MGQREEVGLDEHADRAGQAAITSLRTTYSGDEGVHGNAFPQHNFFQSAPELLFQPDAGAVSTNRDVSRPGLKGIR